MFSLISKYKDHHSFLLLLSETCWLKLHDKAKFFQSSALMRTAVQDDLVEKWKLCSFCLTLVRLLNFDTTAYGHHAAKIHKSFRTRVFYETAESWYWEIFVVFSNMCTHVFNACLQLGLLKKSEKYIRPHINNYCGMSDSFALVSYFQLRATLFIA